MAANKTRLPKYRKVYLYLYFSISICSLVLIVASILYTQFFHQPSASQSASIPKRYPAFLTSPLSENPHVKLPYTALTVFSAFHSKHTGVIHSNGWACCVTYQPEGSLIGWQESYGVELEIATFATPAEVKTDASDLLKHSVGYAVYTKNLCLFFYDHSISKAQFNDYAAVLSTICL